MDRETEKLLVELEPDPSDRGLLTVLADHLQQQGDPRGELIVLDLTASTDQAAMERRRALCLELAPKFAPKTKAKTTWGVGFIRKLEMKEPGASLAKHEGFAHPSCRLLESLTFGTWHALGVTVPDGVLPRSLRTLIAREKLTKNSDLSGLPHLQHLLCMESGRLINASLSSLTLDNPPKPTLEALRPDDLPALRSLTIEKLIEPFLERIAKFLPQLTDLALVGCVFDDDYEALEEALAGHKLATLTLDPWRNPPLDRERLAGLCDELVIPANNKSTPAVGSYVTHATFGRGQVLREFDGKLEIAFPGGTRMLKDGPYLKRQ